MALLSHTFRIFVSSTFSDLKAERDALQAHVFPDLRKLCEKHAARFQPVDLRWGVSEEAALDQQTMRICLGEIERCQKVSPRPNFIILLGNRYGWRPLPREIPLAEFSRLRPFIPGSEQALAADWYRRDGNAVPEAFVLQPRLPELASIPVSEFERLLASPRLSPADRGLLQHWYEPGRGKEPVSSAYFGANPSGSENYILRSGTDREFENLLERFRAVRLAESFFWQGRQELDPPQPGIESRLHAVLEFAALAAKLPEADLVKFQASATEQEILHGAMQVVNSRENIFCFTREMDLHASQDLPGEYYDLQSGRLDHQAADRLLDLKVRLKRVLGKNYHEYPARWEAAGPSLDHIDQFCQDVYDSLAQVIRDQVTRPLETASISRIALHLKPDENLDAEGLAHQKFAEERLRFFVGRKEILGGIDGYLMKSGQRSLAIVGSGGMGKSALMARAIEHTLDGHPHARIVYRFIGATPDSSDGRCLLESLSSEISRRYGARESSLWEYKHLVQDFPRVLALATSQAPLVLFLDSLDQLSSSQGARTLTWLPAELPRNVSVIVSTRPEDTFQNMQAKQSLAMELGGLTRQDGDDLLTLWLDNVQRTLQPAQHGEVLDRFECKGLPKDASYSPGNPLYLKLAFEEARLWASYSPPEQLASGVKGIIEHNMIDRLQDEASHGDLLVSHALGYLAASRNGLAEDELLDLLSRDEQVYGWFFLKSHHLPSDLVQAALHYRIQDVKVFAVKENLPVDDLEGAAVAWLLKLHDLPQQRSEFLKEILPKAGGPRLPVVLWSRLSFDLAPYLTERMADGSPLLNFYHRELGEVSGNVFLAGGQQQDFHARLASYFADLPLSTTDQRDTIPNLRVLSELPYQHAKAGQWSQYVQVLSNFDFLQAKVTAVGPSALIEDYDWFSSEKRQPDQQPEQVALQHIQDTLRLATQILAGDPGQLAGQLLARLLGDESPVIRSLTAQAALWRAATWLRPLTPGLTPPGGPLIRTLQGHASPVDAVTLTPDGHLAISGDVDGDLIVWDLEQGTKIHRLRGHGSYITNLVITPDGKRAVSGSYDSTIRVWDLEHGKCLHVLQGHSMSIFSLAMTHDGRRAASCDMKTLRIWDLEQGVELANARIKGNGLDATIDDQARIAFCQSGKEILQFNLDTGQKLETRRVKKAGAYFRAITSDGQLAFTHNSGTVSIWDVNTGQEIGQLKGHTSSIQGFSISPGGRWMATASSDRSVRVWDVPARSEFRKYDHPDQVRCAFNTPDGRFVISGSQDHSVRVFDTQRVEGKARIVTHPDEISDVAISPDGRLAASAGGDRIHIWEFKTAKWISTLSSQDSDFTKIGFAGNGRLVSAEWEHNPDLTVWDLSTGKSLNRMRGHAKGIWSLAVSPDGRHALSGSGDVTFVYWDLERGKPSWRGLGREGLCDEVMAAAFLPAGRQVLLGYYNGEFRLWDLENEKELATLEGHSMDKRELSRHPELSTLGQLTNPLVRGLAVPAGGRIAISASTDRTARVWELPSGRQLMSFRGHTDKLRDVAVDAAGVRAVTASDDHTLQVWEVSSGVLIAKFTGDGHFNSCAMSSDGLDIVAGDAAGRMHFFRLEIAVKLPAARSVAPPSPGPVIPRKFPVEPAAKPAVIPSVKPVLKPVVIPPVKPALTPAVTPVAKSYATPVMKPAVKLVPKPSGLPRIGHLALDNDGCLLTGHDDGSLRIWQPKQAGPELFPGSLTSPLSALAMSSDGKLAASGSAAGVVQGWDLIERWPFAKLEFPVGISALAITAQGQVAVGLEDGSLHVGILNGKMVQLAGHDQRIASVAILRNGDVVSGSADLKVRCWDSKNGKLLKSFINMYATAVTMAASLDDNRVAWGCADGHMYRWDPDKPDAARSLKTILSPVLAVSAGARDLYLSSGKDGLVQVFDYGARQVVLKQEYELPVVAAALAPGGKWAAVCDNQASVYLLDLMSLPPSSG